MSFVRFVLSPIGCVALVLVSLLIACGQRPPIETTILPAANESPTPFVNVQAATAQPENTPTESPTAEGTLTAAPVVFSTDLPTATLQPIPTFEALRTTSATQGITSSETISPTTPTPVSIASL